ncbi:MAG: sugar ABC transporter ATP-binding protein [Alphaproteobacteria bacterium]|nr:sugar ABC transporter ATP-binding protein [Alphaproteobacteria bacterium]
MGEQSPALAIRNLSKSFGGARALDSVDLTVKTGEVHGLLGQNGSGKSTLIKVLSGYHEAEPGAEVALYGRPVALPITAGALRRLGLAFVHQHLGLVPSLTVLENLRIGTFATETRWFIDWRKERAQARAIFERFELDINPRSIVAELPQVERALLAIVRAFEQVRASQTEHGGGGILVLDEPTPFLPKAGVEQLFSLVRNIVKDGASVIFVSHDIDECLAITDRATVLRDGHVAGTLKTRGSTHSDFVELIVGRRVAAYQVEHDSSRTTAIDIAVEGLSGGVVQDFSIELRAGEIVGLTGLIGSGFSDVPYLLYGATPAQAGHLVIGARRHAIAHIDPARAQHIGLVLLPSDRLGSGGIGGLPVTDNVTLPVLTKFVNAGMLDRRGMVRRARELGETYDVRPNRPEMTLESLSGGNQQKVLLAKWLQTEPHLLLLDEPTQGVDIGARQQIYQAIDEASAKGMAVVCSSTDYEQLAQICDRVLVFARGVVVRQLEGAEITKENIAEQVYTSQSLRMPGTQEAVG